MFVVTGTKRSGTSMWMQILRSAGIPIVGEAFPSRWKQTIADANPAGFYESRFRSGIYFRTNPNPKTGEYIAPDSVRGHAVKIFIPGLVKSDVAFIDRVLVTIRPFREYARSIERLHRIEHASRDRLEGVESPLPAAPSPVLEWWSEMHAVLRDVLVRGHATHFVAYESAISDPSATVNEVLAWLGAGDPSRAVTTPRADLRTAVSGDAVELPACITHEHISVFDEFHDRVRDRGGIEFSFIERLERIHDELEPYVLADRTRFAEARARERAVVGRSRANSVD